MVAASFPISEMWKKRKIVGEKSVSNVLSVHVIWWRYNGEKIVAYVDSDDEIEERRKKRMKIKN